MHLRVIDLVLRPPVARGAKGAFRRDGCHFTDERRVNWLLRQRPPLKEPPCAIFKSAHLFLQAGLVGDDTSGKTIPALKYFFFFFWSLN